MFTITHTDTSHLTSRHSSRSSLVNYHHQPSSSKLLCRPQHQHFTFKRSFYILLFSQTFPSSTVVIWMSRQFPLCRLFKTSIFLKFSVHIFFNMLISLLPESINFHQHRQTRQIQDKIIQHSESSELR